MFTSDSDIDFAASKRLVRPFAPTNMDNTLALLKSVFDTSLVGIMVMAAVRDSNGKIEDFQIEFVNKEMELQSDRKDLPGKRVSEIYPSVRLNGVFAMMQRVIKTDKPRQIERHYSQQGGEHWYQTMFVKVDDGIVSTNLDITSRKLAEIKAREQDKRRIMELFEANLEAHEAERKRIAESIHNGLGQLLYGVKLSLDGLKLKEDLHGSKLVESKTLSMKLLADAIKESRRLSHQLSPAILEDFGLKAAIMDTCDQFRSIVNVSFSFRVQTKLSPAIQITLYRFIQELLHNMAKHAGAANCRVILLAGPECARLMVEDDGQGIQTQKGDGLGLRSIRNQVRLLQGSFDMESTPGQGTKIKISLPLV